MCQIGFAGELLAQTAAIVPSIPESQTWQVAGLQHNAEILVDTWGVPHIYAENEPDLFFAQGFNAARDRLFQLDLWRRRGLGELSSVYGDAYLEQDRAARLFLYRGDMQKEWASYGKQAAQISTSFVAGINAYVDFVTAHPEALPFEFKKLNYLPAKWQAADIVRIRSHGLTRNLNSEVARAKLACAGELELDLVRQGLTPTWKTKVPKGLDPCLPNDVLRQFTLATQNVSFDAKNLQLSLAENSPATTYLERNNEEPMEGSNNWVIAPSKSTAGRAILANDPHRAYSAPSLRYIAHLRSPTLDVIGAGEPALPGISIGHNGTIAFGLTIMSIDQEDLYVLETNPENSMQYKYRG
ncbi:MAG: penicillin acylase family protein, partial [Undibacterium sp.]|nr:penicillin acylase family protein [Undibacterium sp.]